MSRLGLKIRKGWEERELMVQMWREKQICQEGNTSEAVRGASALGWTSVGGFCSVHTKPCNKSLFLKVTGKNLFFCN